MLPLLYRFVSMTIYPCLQDALTLKKVVLNKKNELDLQRNSQPPVRSKRIRHRKAYAGQRLSLVIAALDSDSDKEDMVAPPITVPQPDYEDMDSGGEESTNETEEDPLWLLYRAVKGQRNSLGLRISEPFLKLPSKRYLDIYIRQTIYEYYIYVTCTHFICTMSIYSGLANDNFKFISLSNYL